MRMLIIPAGGRGTRAWPLTDTKHGTPKLFLRIAGKSMLEHILASYPRAVFEETRIILSPHYAHLDAFFKDEARRMSQQYETRIRLAYQSSPPGNAFAVYDALRISPYPSDALVTIHFADTLVKHENAWMLPSDVFTLPKEEVRIGVKHVHNPHAYGVFLEDKQRVIEKPKQLKEGDALIGVYTFPARVLAQGFEETLPHEPRGEYGLDAILNHAARSVPLKPIRVDAWYDTGTLRGLYTAHTALHGQPILDQGCIHDTPLPVRGVGMLGRCTHAENLSLEKSILGPNANVSPTRSVTLRNVLVTPGTTWHPKEERYENLIIHEDEKRGVRFIPLEGSVWEDDLREAYKEHSLLE